VIDDLVGIPETLQPSLYPNPTADVVFIQNLRNTFNVVQVLDMNGKVLQTETLNGNHQLNMSQFARGTFIIQFTGNAGIHRELLIKE